MKNSRAKLNNQTFYGGVYRQVFTFCHRRICIALALLMALLLPLTAIADELKPFTTDGCSAFPDGDRSQNAKWIDCCIRHDFAYWKGGTVKEREKADAELKQCVEELGEKNISLLMHLGVRLGGSPFYPTWYRWGYGWPYLRGYEPLSEEEQQQVVGQLQILKNLVSEFIEESK